MEYFSKSCDIDGHIYLEDVSVSFEASVKKSWREPYSWGESRGYDYEIDAVSITGVEVGGLVLTEAQAILMFGQEAIDKVFEGVSLDDMQ